VRVRKRHYKASSHHQTVEGPVGKWQIYMTALTIVIYINAHVPKLDGPRAMAYPKMTSRQNFDDPADYP
jgi:hypothetical protein